VSLEEIILGYLGTAPPEGPVCMEVPA
jgi:hypothetical protein